MVRTGYLNPFYGSLSRPKLPFDIRCKRADVVEIALTRDHQ
jgi:hypothetical protein